MAPMRDSSSRAAFTLANAVGSERTSERSGGGGLLSGLTALERDEARLNDQMATLCREIGTLQPTVSGLKGDVERITERLPDPTHGPLDKVRDALTGRGDSPAGGRELGRDW